LTGTVQPYQALRMTPEAALLTRTFMRRRVPSRAGMYEASFGPPVDVAPDPVRFAVRFGAAAAVATAPRPLVASVLADLDPAAASAPLDLAALLLELALEPELARLEAAVPALAVTLGADAADISEPFAVGLACTVGGSEGSVRLDLDMATARELARLLERVPLRRAPLPHIPLTLRVRTMAATLTVGQLRTLGEADVVLADALPDAELLVVVGERLVWRARREGRMVRLLSERFLPRAVGLGGWVMDNATDAAGDATNNEAGNGTGPADDARIADLPIRVVFEVGRVELPLGELETLGSGYVFELQRDPDQAVDIVANGRRIGRGRLVEVAGAIGVADHQDRPGWVTPPCCRSSSRRRRWRSYHSSSSRRRRS